MYARVGARVRVKKINPQQNFLFFLTARCECIEKGVLCFDLQVYIVSYNTG